MSEERKKVLEMLAEGKISVDEAERLLEAQQSAAILTTFNEVDLQAVNDLRKRHRESFEKSHETRLGYMSFFVKASVEALKRFPVVNAPVDRQDIIYHGYYDIGIAIGSGADIALETGDVVLMSSDPRRVATSLALARRDDLFLEAGLELAQRVPGARQSAYCECEIVVNGDIAFVTDSVVGDGAVNCSLDMCEPIGFRRRHISFYTI